MKVQDLEKKLPNYEAEQRKALLKVAVDEFESKGDQLESAHALLLLGNQYRESGQLEDAVSSYSKSAETFGKLGDLYGEAASLNNLGFVNKLIGETNNALNNYEKALSIYRNLGDKEHESIPLLNIAKLYYSMGEHLEAIEYFEDSLELSNKPAGAETLYALGNSYSKVNDHTRALESLEKALEQARSSEDSMLTALVLRSITGTYLGMGDAEKAGAIVAENEELFKQLPRSFETPQPNPDIGEKNRRKLERVDLVDIVSSVLLSCSPLIEAKNIKVVFKASGDEILINSDREILSQVINDLISNAVKNTPAGKNIYAYISRNEDSVRCEILDEGDDTAGSAATNDLTRFIGGELRREGMLGKGSAYIIEFPNN